MDFIEIIQDILYFLLKVLIVVLVIAITFLVGAMLGYSLIGEGGNPLDVLNPQVWQQIFAYFVS